VAVPPVRALVYRLTGRARGPWRVAVAEASMQPAIEPGDWLLVDPTIQGWPRPGSVVVFREPGSDVLAIKRVVRRLPGGNALLEGDAANSHDSRHYGAVAPDRLVGRAWFRYAPVRRIGRIPGRRDDPAPGASSD
jgi:signal peptidase I